MDNNELHWFPMRVTYSRELTVKEFLDTIGVESFIPMHYEPIEGRHPRHQVLKPAIRNLIFVHSTQAVITEMKMTRREVAPLRYMMSPVLNQDNLTHHSEILTVPDKQMEDFRRVLDQSLSEGGLMDVPLELGDRVRVTKGALRGVEGRVLEFHGKTYVVVELLGSWFAKASVPRAWLELI